MSRLEERERELVRDALVGRDLVELEEALAATDLRAQEQELLLKFPALRGGEEILQAARSLVDNQGSAEAIDELQAVYRLLGAHGVEARVNLDLGAVRDFDYYTGLIFEVFAPGLGAPLAAGGRYDGLLRRFGADEPATGLVVFLDRVQQLLEGRAGGNVPSESVLVGFSDDAAAAIRESVRRRGGGERVVMAVDPSSGEELERRRRALGAASAVLVDGSQRAT
jgi:ATP phosphoribosyltransferase regulatory subunit